MQVIRNKAPVPLWHCEACNKKYSNQAQAIAHLVQRHEMSRAWAVGILERLKTQHRLRQHPMEATCTQTT